MGTLERFNLSRNRLSFLPGSISHLNNLRELNVSYNEILFLPEEIARLNKLHYLNFSSNKLFSLPDTIGKLAALRTLILSNNQLEVVTPRLGDLKNLTWLDISYNKLDTFPKNLPIALKKIYLGNNKLRSIEGNEVKRLKNLKELSVPNNKLTKLPKELLELSETLVVLDIEHNKFTDKFYETSDLGTLLLKLKGMFKKSLLDTCSSMFINCDMDSKTFGLLLFTHIYTIDPNAKVVPPQETKKAIEPSVPMTAFNSGYFGGEEEHVNKLYRFKGQNRIVMQKVCAHSPLFPLLSIPTLLEFEQIRRLLLYYHFCRWKHRVLL